MGGYGVRGRQEGTRSARGHEVGWRTRGQLEGHECRLDNKTSVAAQDVGESRWREVGRRVGGRKMEARFVGVENSGVGR